jgi:uncharacterized RmlC-like cupin family protein
MTSSRPIVLSPDGDLPEPLMSDAQKREFFLRESRWADSIRNEAGDVSEWHHHAANDTYVYVIRGSVTIDFGPGGADSIVARAGDFFIVPSKAIHRETTSPESELAAFVIRVGGGEPEHVAVDGPEPG